MACYKVKKKDQCVMCACLCHCVFWQLNLKTNLNVMCLVLHVSLILHKAYFFFVWCVIYETCIYLKIQWHIYYCIKYGSFCLKCSSFRICASDVVSAVCVSCVFLCHRAFSRFQISFLIHVPLVLSCVICVSCVICTPL